MRCAGPHDRTSADRPLRLGAISELASRRPAGDGFSRASGLLTGWNMSASPGAGDCRDTDRDRRRRGTW